MFREMRRKRQELSKKETAEIFRQGTSGVLAVSGDDGYPYAVPLSYVYEDSKLYFHGAKSGHKLDAVRKDSRASFCVIGQDRIVSEEFTTYFRSSVVFGKIRILEDEQERRNAIEKLAAKYSPDDGEGLRKEIDREMKVLCMMELTVEHMTGKESIELVSRRSRTD